MIYLITGTPGTGKTALAVSMILNNKDGLFRYTAEDGTETARPLYFCHIDGLDERKFKAHPLTEEQIQAAPLNEIVPEGAVVIVDEADYAYPTRAAAREVPPYIKTLKELRHHGLTLILMTQHPTMLDSYLRNLVGKHWHLERKQIGTKLYEFNRCESNLAAAMNSPQAVSEFYKPDKKAFAYYKSASKHIKFRKRLHPIFYAFAVGVVLFACFAWYTAPDFIARYYGGGETEQTTPQSAPDVQETPVEPPSDTYPAQAPQTPPEVVAAGSKAEHYRPAIGHMPETKPLYDPLRQVKQMEFPVACVDSGQSCHCYTHQATRIPLPLEVCRLYVAEGLPFNPYKDPQTATAAPPPATEQGMGPDILLLDGQTKPNLAYSTDAPRSAQ